MLHRVRTQWRVFRGAKDGEKKKEIVSLLSRVTRWRYRLLGRRRSYVSMKTERKVFSA